MRLFDPDELQPQEIRLPHIGDRHDVEIDGFVPDHDMVGQERAFDDRNALEIDAKPGRRLPRDPPRRPIAGTRMPRSSRIASARRLRPSRRMTDGGKTPRQDPPQAIQCNPLRRPRRGVPGAAGQTAGYVLDDAATGGDTGRDASRRVGAVRATASAAWQAAGARYGEQAGHAGKRPRRR